MFRREMDITGAADASAESRLNEGGKQRVTRGVGTERYLLMAGHDA